MRKHLSVLIAAGMLAFAAPAQAHPNYDYEGGCEVTTAPDGTDSSGTTWTAEVRAVFVATTAGDPPTPASTSIAFECHMYIDGWFYATIAAGAGVMIASDESDFTYQADPDSVVSVCDVVVVGGESHTRCRNVTTTPLIPQPVADVLDMLGVWDLVPGGACDDGLDNDGDGHTDSGDPGCDGPGDGDERGWTQCDDGADNDGDVVRDYPADAGCTDPWDDDESGNSPPTLLGCDDGLDNDRDGYTDSNDPGCTGPSDGDERGTIACDDGVDNDGDGTADYPADSGCSGPTDDDEGGIPACADGVDNDGGGQADYPNDPGCASWSDVSELGGPCDDGADNDGDGLADSTDPGCSSQDDSSERGSLPCDDDVDNDGDGLADYPADPGCRAAADPNETTIP